MADRSVRSLLARAIDATRVNEVVRGERDGTPVWIKRRRRCMSAVVAAGNVFLRLSRSRIVMFSSTARWKQRELDAARTLYGSDAAGDAGPRAIWSLHVPGESLEHLLDRGALGPAALGAAAGALRAAHARVGRAGDPFSHGDPHTQNVLFDGRTARLIDFETEHEPGLPAADRHADDVLVLALDLLGRAGRDDGVAAAAAVTLAYGDDALRARVRERLVPPRGLEAVLWSTRTARLPAPELAIRLSRLRARLSR